MNTTNNPTGKKVKIVCPHCQKTHLYKFGALIGKLTSPRKELAAIANGKKGGRPKKAAPVPVQLPRL